jgi:hypothetical protein
MEEWGLLAMILLVLSVVFSLIASLRVRKQFTKGEEEPPSPAMFTRLSWISALVAYFFIDSFRRYLVDEAYTHDIVFDNVAEYSFGLPVLLVTFVLNLVIPRIAPEATDQDIIESVKEKTSSRIRSIYGPTFVIYMSIHLTALLMILLSYGYWAGWGETLDGPKYYTEMLFTYGLNRDARNEIPWYVTTFSWILAPIFVLIVGTIFFFIKSTGFAPNGPSPARTSPEEVLLGEGYAYDTWAYFSMDVPNVDETNYLSNNPKYNAFYLGVVWGSIFIGTIIGTVLNMYLFKKDNQARYFPFLKYIMVIGWFVGWIFATMSAPVFVLPSGIFQSLIFERDTNHLVKYKWVLAEDPDNGFYSPISIFWFITIIWTFVIAVILGVGGFLRYLLTGDFLKKTERTDVKGRYVEDEITELPFTKEKIIQN